MEVLTQVDPEKLSGRDLDAAVAERVMGWQRQPDYNYWMSFPAGESFSLHALIATWSPSESIEAAMQVVEKMWQLGWSIEMANGGKLGTLATARIVSWYVRFVEDENDLNNWSAEAETLPEAICRAALRAVEQN